MNTLRSRLLAALLALLALNGAFIAVGLKTITSMNRVNSEMYDKVVMASTYAQMCKNDFLRYTEAVNSALLEASAEARGERWAAATDAATTLAEDLTVVRERLIAPDDLTAIENFKKQWTELEVARAELHHEQTSGALGGAKGIGASLTWMRSPERHRALETLSDLTEKVLADGYGFRMDSDAHATFVQRAALLLSLAILAINILCISYILFSVLPRLKSLAATCLEIASGQFDKRVTMNTRDEFGSLAGSFNTMLEVIRDREDRLNDQLITTSAMVNSLGQGFLMFDARGICLDVFSKSCFDLFEAMPAGKSIFNVLATPLDEELIFDEWIKILFAEKIEFEDAAKLGPVEYKHSQGRRVFLEYKPVYSSRGTIKSVVVIATDRTEELRAQKMIDTEQAFSRMVMRMLHNRGDFMRLLKRMNESIRQLPEQSFAQALRTLHNIKGAAATYSLARLSEAAHASETALLSLHETEDVRARVRVEAGKLEAVYESIVEELKTLSGFTLTGDALRREFSAEALARFHQQLRQLGTGDGGLARKFFEEFVMEPANNYFATYDETLQQIARRQGKRIAELSVEGGALPVLGEVYTPLFEAFVHAFRNAADHGIESPEERAAAGKPEVAKVEVRFARLADQLEITVRDDGRGVNPVALREKLRAAGIDPSVEGDHVVLQRLFKAGFSTAARVSDISGRGVGLDALLDEAVKLGGSAELFSTPGRGTEVRVRVPYVAEMPKTKTSKSA